MSIAREATLVAAASTPMMEPADPEEASLLACAERRDRDWRLWLYAIINLKRTVEKTEE
ncbi:MAG: hypothetical protein SEPTF4163_005995 [Sporothrix epigloea]